MVYLARTANTEGEIRHSGLCTERLARGRRGAEGLKLFMCTADTCSRWERQALSTTTGISHSNTVRAHLGAATDSSDIRWQFLESTRHSSFFELQMAKVF